MKALSTRGRDLPWAVEGRRMTSWPSVGSDLIKAGAHWVDAAMVRDGNLITSREA